MAAPTRIPRNAWTQAGLRALAAGGPSAVRVESLAKALGVTKGGFYWHFADRGALLEAMLQAWERTLVDDVIEQIDVGAGDARSRLRRLFELAVSSSALLEVDLAVRDWARHDADVAVRLARVDDRRAAYLRVLFADFVPDHEDVEMRCLVFGALWIGSHHLAAGHGSQTRTEVLGRALSWLLDESG